MGFRIECWRLQPVELPVVWRHCAGCGQGRAFVCSERFRSNAQKKVLDVWLLYRCNDCEGVWKYPVLSRRRVADIDPALRAAFESNDRVTVWHYAFDLGGLRQHAARIELSEHCRIERRVVMDNGTAGDVIRFESPFPCALRLERVLASQLPLSRSELQRRFEKGELLLEPAHPSGLRKPVRDGQQVCFIGGIEADNGMGTVPAPPQ